MINGSGGAAKKGGGLVTDLWGPLQSKLSIFKKGLSESGPGPLGARIHYPRVMRGSMPKLAKGGCY